MDINDFAVTNIKTEIKNNKRAEENLRLLLPSFSCPVNPDVERFVHEQAIDFSKRNQSVTHLVFLGGELVAYFTLAIKPISVNAEHFSNTMRRKIERVSKVNEQTGEYILAAYLIAQLGKNFADGRNKRISGEMLLRLALGKITQMQDMAGGTVVFLEAQRG